MAAVTWQIGGASLVDPLTILITLHSLLLLLRFKVNSTWLIAAGALIGVLRYLFV
jgi:chromate transporter